VTKLDSSTEKLISESILRLENRNNWLKNSIEDFQKELPKHESFPTSKDMLTSYIGIYQNEINFNTGILQLLSNADEILLRYDIEN
jgi:hypothetical protein